MEQKQIFEFNSGTTTTPTLDQLIPYQDPSGGDSQITTPRLLQSLIGGQAGAVNVATYGGLGDGRMVTDGVATAMSTAFSSATAALTSADATKAITISGGNYAALDTFSGTNGTNLSAHTLNNGGSWTAVGGTIQIQSNKAQVTTYVSSNAIYVTETGLKDINGQVIGTPAIAGGSASFICRYVDANNFVMVEIANGIGYTIYEFISGTPNVRAHSALTPGGDAFQFWVQVIGNKITAVVQSTFFGAPLLTYTGLVNTTATKCGIRSDGSATGATFDDFTVLPYGQSSSFRTTLASIGSSTTATLTAAPLSSISGATCWIGTDNTTPINNMLAVGAALNYLSTGVYLTQGGHNFSASGQQILGAGQGVTVLHLMANSQDLPVFQGINLNDLLVQNLAIDGQNLSQGWFPPGPTGMPTVNNSLQIGVNYGPGVRCNVKDCVIVNMVLRGVSTADTLYCTFENVTGSNNGWGTIVCYCYTNPFAYISVINCSSDQDYLDGMRFSTMNYPYLEGCTCTSNRTAAGIYFENIVGGRINNCICTENTDEGIELRNLPPFEPGITFNKVTGCTLHNNIGGGLALYDLDGCVVTGNSMTNNGQSGIPATPQVGIYINSGDRQTIVGNNLCCTDNTQYYGLHALVTNSSTIVGNTAIGNQSGQILIDSGSGNTVANNTTA